MSLTGLQQINIELTSRCDKHTLCSFCGHQNGEKDLQRGDMDFGILRKIREQIEPYVIISFHRDGDPLAYPYLFHALRLFNGYPVSLVTHGERLAACADAIIGFATTVTISVIPSDPDREMQLDSIRGFLKQKGDLPPMVQLKFVGRIDNPEEYEALGLPIIGRQLHNKAGNWSYKTDPPVPEIRVCLDFLSRPTVDWRGRVFMCNRLDPQDVGQIGDLTQNTLEEIWNGTPRKLALAQHLRGRRDLASPLCASCKYWGIPAAV